MPMVLTLTGTRSIQTFVYGTNRLIENVGASELVADAQNMWWTVLPSEDVLFIGGGNAAFTSSTKEIAVERVRKWSRELLDAAPGLRVSAVHQQYEPGGLAKAYQEARKRLAAREDSPPFGAAFDAFPLSRVCASTGGPAESRHRADGQWISMESLRKRLRGERARHETDRQSMIDLEKLDNDGASHIAICHADGDQVGAWFKEVADNCAADDGRFRQEIGRASKAVNDLVESVFLEIAADLKLLKPALTEAGILDERQHNPDDEAVPLRRLVTAGDDVTFITNGRIGLSVVARYLDLFKKKSHGMVGEELTSSAGVLICPTKFPFSRGYSLADDLTRSAKQQRRQAGWKRPWIDFQILLEGATESIDSLRPSAYRSGSTSLLLRPYEMGSDKEHGWSRFQELHREFSNSERWPRSIVKRLMHSLVRGTVSTDEFISELESRGRRLPEPRWISSNDANITPFFDPLEMLDHHVQIDWDNHRLLGKEQSNAQTAR